MNASLGSGRFPENNEEEGDGGEDRDGELTDDDDEEGPRSKGTGGGGVKSRRKATQRPVVGSDLPTAIGSVRRCFGDERLQPDMSCNVTLLQCLIFSGDLLATVPPCHALHGCSCTSQIPGYL